MEDSSFVPIADKYFNRFSFNKKQIEQIVKSNTKLVIVIPCYNEEKLIKSLTSISNCFVPNNTSVEVITVINHSEDELEYIKDLNKKTYIQATKFSKEKSNNKIQFFTIKAFNLPKKHAGVGLARKIGMDEALYRFKTINKDGVIACFDADSICDNNYIETIINSFNKNNINGASIRFEHPINGSEYNKNIYKAIINYELHLRYYKNALKYTNIPYYFYTIGSSMAVRASAYAKQGGMNKRKAGEDFYFLSKIIKLGNFYEINSTKIIPSPRISDRVPFGTGKAVGEIVKNNVNSYKTYNFKAFEDLKMFFSQIENGYQKNNYNTLPISLQKFITQNNYSKKITEIKKNTKTLSSYKQRFYFVFDSFWILKFVHFYRDNIESNNLLNTEVKKLLKSNNITYDKNINNHQLLIKLREIDKK